VREEGRRRWELGEGNRPLARRNRPERRRIGTDSGSPAGERAGRERVRVGKEEDEIDGD
jgi:hypothetical protein